MDKKVIVSVKGNQNQGDEQSDGVELITYGSYSKKGNEYTLTYHETEITGMQGTVTTLKVVGDRVILMRFGSNNSQMVFEKGHKHTGYYETPYGSFTISTLSNQMQIDLGDKGGEIKVGYTLQIDNELAGENDFHLQIKEAKKAHDKLGSRNN